MTGTSLSLLMDATCTALGDSDLTSAQRDLSELIRPQQELNGQSDDPNEVRLDCRGGIHSGCGVAGVSRRVVESEITSLTITGIMVHAGDCLDHI